MHGRFKYEKLSTYPHLAPGDKILWERFIDAFPDEYETVDYDMHVGEGVQFEDKTKVGVYQENQTYLTQKRIDVCGYRKNGNIDCIEVRPRAGSGVIGTVVVNHKLLSKLYPNNVEKAIIITDRAQSDIKQCCHSFGIEIIELDK